jgi:hypothetical protein
MTKFSCQHDRNKYIFNKDSNDPELNSISLIIVELNEVARKDKNIITLD